MSELEDIALVLSVILLLYVKEARETLVSTLNITVKTLRVRNLHVTNSLDIPADALVLNRNGSIKANTLRLRGKYNAKKIKAKH